MDLTEPKTLRALLDRHGLRAKKGLGQHFLCSAKVVEAILGRLGSCRSALEIGPGPGILTAGLCELGLDVYAIEFDAAMPAALAESAPCAKVETADALRVDIAARLRQLAPPRAVVSNLPYYITGPLLTKIAEAGQEFELAVLMMQKEVAQRVLAAEGTSERGSLSVYLQLQFEIEKVVDAPPGAFIPPPKVSSSVLQFTPRPAADVSSIPPEVFSLIRIGFAQPRKTLVNNLVAGLRMEREHAQTLVESAGHDGRIRPQQLSNAHWVELAQSIYG